MEGKRGIQYDDAGDREKPEEATTEKPG